MFFAFYVVKHVLENLCHVYEACVRIELALYLNLSYNNNDCHHEPNGCDRYCFVEPNCCGLVPLLDSAVCLVDTLSGCCDFHLCGSRVSNSSCVAFL